MNPSSVFKDWLSDLPYRMQSVLASSLRGCDTVKKDDPSKFIQRAMRGIILNNADLSNTFISGDIPDQKIVTQFLWDIDAYPMHYVMHTAHAAEIIGYKHSDPRLMVYWTNFYQDICKGLHVNFETETQLDVRLGFTPEEKKVRQKSAHKARMTQKKVVDDAVKEAKHKWDAGTGTSHGGRKRQYSGAS